MTFTQNLYDIFFFEKGPEMCDKLIKQYSFCEYLDDSLEKFRIQNFIFFLKTQCWKWKLIVFVVWVFLSGEAEKKRFLCFFFVLFCSHTTHHLLFRYSLFLTSWFIYIELKKFSSSLYHVQRRRFRYIFIYILHISTYIYISFVFVKTIYFRIYIWTYFLINSYFNLINKAYVVWLDHRVFLFFKNNKMKWGKKSIARFIFLVRTITFSSSLFEFSMWEWERVYKASIEIFYIA